MRLALRLPQVREHTSSSGEERNEGKKGGKERDTHSRRVGIKRGGGGEETERE